MANILGNIRIVAHRATNLNDASFTDKADTYLKVRLDSQDSKDAQKGRVHEDAGKDSTFEETFDFNLQGNERSICLEIWDKNSLKDDKLAYIILPLDDIVASGNVQQRWYTLTRTGGKKEGGQLQLSIFYQQAAFNARSNPQVSQYQGQWQGQQQQGGQQQGQWSSGSNAQQGFNSGSGYYGQQGYGSMSTPMGNMNQQPNQQQMWSQGGSQQQQQGGGFMAQKASSVDQPSVMNQQTGNVSGAKEQQYR